MKALNACALCGSIVDHLVMIELDAGLDHQRDDPRPRRDPSPISANAA